MLFQRNNINIVENLYLDKPVEDLNFNWELDFFDREGYQLNSIEKEYHAVNEVKIHTEDRMARRVSDDALNVVLQHWYEQTKPHPNIFIDHAHILHRFGFTGPARMQLIEKAKIHPKLYKMVRTKPKYGLDFAIDWIDERQVVELFHIELDCHDHYTFVGIVNKLQTFIETTNWEKLGPDFVARKNKWQEMDEYEQAKYKAKFFGLDKIGIDYFSDHYLNKPYLFTYLKVID